MLRRRALVFFAGRVAAGFATLLVVSLLIFVGTNVLPGSAARALLGAHARPAAVAALESRLNLDRPAWERYLVWLRDFARGDFGRSAAAVYSGDQARTSVAAIIGRPALNSAILAGLTVALLLPLTFVLGVALATRAGRPSDQIFSVASLGLVSLPEFVTGSFLVAILAVWLGWLPGVSLVAPGESVLSHPVNFVLPVLTLLAASLAVTVRYLRASMVETLQSDYVASAQLGGVRHFRVLWSYALRNALPPSVQVVAQTAQWLVGGIVITETIFSYPGLGQLLVNSVSVRDVPLVQSVALLLAAVYISLNILADFVVTLLVPKPENRPLSVRLAAVVPGSLRDAHRSNRLRFLRIPGAKPALGVVVFIFLLAFVGPPFAPHDPNLTLGPPFQSSSGTFLFGTDYLGRDVLSRFLVGGRTVLALSLAATLIAYALGLTGGLIAGFSRSWRDALVMRAADVLLAFPPLIFLLVVATGAGQNLAALVLSIGLIQAPGLARITRSAVLDVSVRNYVEAALARGETTAAIIRREILPNILGVLLADIGLRLGYSVLLLASVNFLGLGVQPPQADWARMISENRIGISQWPWVVVIPALPLAALTISVNVVADAIARTLGTSIEALETEAGGR